MINKLSVGQRSRWSKKEVPHDQVACGNRMSPAPQQALSYAASHRGYTLHNTGVGERDLLRRTRPSGTELLSEV